MADEGEGKEGPPPPPGRVHVEGLSGDQVSQAHAVFCQADVDGGGTLDRKELRLMFAKLGLVLTPAQMGEYVDSHALMADKDDE